MKRSSLFSIWGILYIICAGLGFIPEPEAGIRVFLLLISLLFFVPPGILLWDAIQTGDSKTKKQLRNLSALSLGLTLVSLIASILSALSIPTLGTVLHVILGLVSTPMFCSNYWAVSLFLWAVLLIAAGKK